MYMQPMHNHVRDKLYRNARTIGNVHVGPTSIYGLEAVHDQLLLELDHHVALEDNPERVVLDDGVAEGSGPWVDRVGVGGVSDDVEAAIAAPDGIAAEPCAAVGKALAVLVPGGVASPAVVNGVAREAGEVAQFTAVLCAVLDTPAQLKKN